MERSLWHHFWTGLSEKLGWGPLQLFSFEAGQSRLLMRLILLQCDRIWQIFATLATLWGIFSTWEFFETMLAIFKNNWANFHCWTLTKIGHLIKSSGHTVLLLAPLSLLCSKQWKQKMNFLIDSRFIFDENDEARLRQKTASHPVYLLSSMMGPLGAYLWNSVGINLRKDQIAMNSTFCKFWRANKLGCCCCFVNLSF